VNHEESTGSDLRLRPACRVFGHRYRFSSEGNTMYWRCQRGCGAAGEKQYPTADHARRYAAAFDREDREDLGRRAPLFGLLPLRLIRAARKPVRR
jgi:hypothetical protein